MSMIDLPETQNKKGKNVAIDQLRDNLLDLSKSPKGRVPRTLVRG